MNLGDSFASIGSLPRGGNLKPKDLIGIPWRAALALQADGWWLRSDIVWAKPNAMPEPIRDRPTRAHEFVFLLSKSQRYFYDAEAVREPGVQSVGWNGTGGRNRRSVWEVATQCFKGAHFATFPEGLVEPCILAGSSPTACRTCGAPWRRVVSSRRLIEGEEAPRGKSDPQEELTKGRGHSRSWARSGKVLNHRETVGWEPSCDHDYPGDRCTVIDPFAGAATTGIVAARHGRNFLGVELSPSFAEIGRQRLASKGITTEASAV